MSRTFLPSAYVGVDAEMCRLCRRHVRDHFGGTERRCDPADLEKPEASGGRAEYATLKGLYNAVVDERDKLRSRVEALEAQVRDLSALETTRLICDECQHAEVSVTGQKTKGFERVLELARERKWTIDGLGHICPLCAHKRLKS